MAEFPGLRADDETRRDQPLGTLPFGSVLTRAPEDEDAPTVRHITDPGANAPARFAPGELLGAFVLGERLGTDPSGLGERFAAAHPDHGACQVLALDLPASAACGARFLLRARLLHLAAPDPPEEPDPLLELPLALGAKPRPWVALPHRAVPSLESLLRRGPLPPARAGEVIRDLARGLELAWRARRAHGDPHPAHVEVPPGAPARWTGWMRLAHVGLGGVRRPYSGGPELGDVCYLAPEVLGGKKHSAKSNVYALGAMLYRALLGRPPFEGEPSEVQRRARGEGVAPLPPREELPEPLRSDLGRRLLALTMRMLARDPHLRPAPGELILQLEAALDGRDLGAPRRRPRRWSWLLLALALAAALAAALLWLR